MMRANRRDTNEPEILDLFKKMGALWKPMQPGAGFDGLLICRGHIYVVEIKMPGKKLTECEHDMQFACIMNDVVYYVLNSVEDAQAMVEAG
jgi:hypothetical protein